MQTYRSRMLADLRSTRANPCRHAVVVTIAFLFSGCGPSATHPDACDPTCAGPTSRANHDPAGECAAAQFVPCATNDECTKRDGRFLMPRPCFDHAADACAAAACRNGCDILPGGSAAPGMVLCSISAQFSSHMKICGGFSGWGCPENMHCVFTPEAARADDATGTCEPITQ